MPHSLRWSSAGRTLLAGCVVLALTGCDRDEAPTGTSTAPTPALSAAGQQGRPFYYYESKPVYLRADPTRIVVASSLDSAPELASQILARNKVSMLRADPLRQARGHWLILSPGADEAAAGVVVAELKRDKRFRFAATAYKTEDGRNDVVLLDEVIVKFKDGVTRQQIDSLNKALGTAVVREPRPDSAFFEYHLSYPADSAADPLTIAALLDRHPLVQWAEPNMISNRAPTAVPTDPYYPLEWHLNSTTTRNGIRVNINVEPAWNITLGGGVPSQGGIRVGVIGTGVQMTHPDFGSNVQGGFDAVLGNNTFGCTDCATSPFGGDSHETHVAGMIVGQHSMVAESRELHREPSSFRPAFFEDPRLPPTQGSQTLSTSPGDSAEPM